MFFVLRVLADREEQPAHFLILGSASPELSRQASESLAGRIEIIEMSGFSLAETDMEDLNALWLRGGFPRSFLADSEEEQTFMVRQLQPWFANVKKRLVKRPKLYFRDSGLYHFLMGIENRDDLLRHPKLGASWETFALGQVLRILNPDEAYFYAVHSGTELDLYIPGKEKLGVEFKRQDAPKVTKSMRNAIEDLGLARLWVIYPGSREYALINEITVKPIRSLADLAD